jgi:CheY-like chemotaxis protein
MNDIAIVTLGTATSSAVPMTAQPSMTILLVEDDDDDRIFVRRAVRTIGIEARVETVSSADEAEDYLMGRNKFADRRRFPLPDLVLCDLVMPLRSGLELLTWLKRESPFQHMRAIAMSGTGDLDQLHHLRSLGLGEIVDKTSMVLNPAVLANAIKRVQG